MIFDVLPSVTTTHPNWRNQITEIDELGIKRIGFFPTCLSKDERKEACQLLEKTGLVQIPFVHIKNDGMTIEDIEYFSDRFGTTKFNIHSPADTRYPMIDDLSKHAKKIYVENTSYKLTDVVADWAGICLDVTHMRSAFLRNDPLLNDWEEALARSTVGAWHLSAIYEPPLFNQEEGRFMYDVHHFDQLSRFDYIVNFKQHLAPIVALELENTLEEQLQAVEYVRNLLTG